MLSDAPTHNNTYAFLHQRTTALAANVTHSEYREVPMPITSILFDFFGTLVDYRASVEGEGFRGSFGLFRELGGNGDYPRFLEEWEANAAEFESDANRTQIEYPLEELVLKFLRSHEISEAHTDHFIATFIAEWNSGVTYDDDVIRAVRALARDYRVGVVTNTHLPWLVPRHIAAMGLADVFPEVTTSIEVGWRKPHPEIFAVALGRLGSEPPETLFIGDSFDADFQGARSAGLQALPLTPRGRQPSSSDTIGPSPNYHADPGKLARGTTPSQIQNLRVSVPP